MEQEGFGALRGFRRVCASHEIPSRMTEQDFIAAFQDPPADVTGGHDRIIAQLRDRLRCLSSEQQFQILFPIAVKNPYIGNFPVLDAALLLKELSPSCPISCEEAIRALLPEWSVSLDQVPLYLAACFGPPHLHRAIANLGSELTNKSQRSSLEAVSYWVHVYEGTWPAKS